MGGITQTEAPVQKMVLIFLLFLSGCSGLLDITIDDDNLVVNGRDSETFGFGGEKTMDTCLSFQGTQAHSYSMNFVREACEQ